MGAKLSVVVPFYGVEEYIDACLASIAASTLRDFECILVDDGSLDGSRGIAERFAASDPRFTIVTQANAGLGAARNTGTAHASGQYLMFVDSDDLVAPRAFEQLVTSLDASGSDFAGGNVWRASPRWGLFVSPAHAEEFARRRTGLTIADVPLLMRDRMIWNKAYRRTFWDAGGYTFPEIRYEDYPVTLKAHLEASAVDLLPDPLYVWRERETGTSISQQGFDIANVRDRVRALHLVLDFVDELASDEVKSLVESYFVQVDLREAMASLLSVPDADQDELERLIASAADRIAPDRVSHAPSFNQLFYRAARTHDWALCRALASWHGGEGWAGFRAALPPRSWTSAERLRAAAELGPAKRALPGARTLECTLASVSVSDSASDPGPVIEAKLRREFARIARVHVTVGGRGVPCAAEPGGPGLRITVPLTASTLGPEARGVEVRVSAGPLRWEGAVSLPSDAATLGLHGGWLAVGRAGDELTLAAPEHPVVLAEGAPAGDASAEGVLADGAGVLDVRVSAGEELALRRPYPDAGPWFAVVAGHARVPLAEALGGDVADNPWSHEGVRPLVVRDAGGERPVYAAAGWRAAGPPDAAVGLRVQDDATVAVVFRAAAAVTGDDAGMGA